MNRELNAEWWAVWEKVGLPFNRDTHYKNWCREGDKLRPMLNALARLRATTLPGLNMKALIIAAFLGEDDNDNMEEWYAEKLRASFMADLARAAKVVA